MTNKCSNCRGAGKHLGPGGWENVTCSVCQGSGASPPVSPAEPVERDGGIASIVETLEHVASGVYLTATIGEAHAAKILEALRSRPAAHLKADIVAAWINADEARAKWVAELSAVRKHGAHHQAVPDQERELIRAIRNELAGPATIGSSFASILRMLDEFDARKGTP